MTTSGRLRVDPAELLAAAAAARDVLGQLALVRETLLAVQASGPQRWAPDGRLAAVARRAVEALLAATDVATDRCRRVERGLAVSAESYARSDLQWVG